MLVIRNLTPADVTASCEALVKAINESQIVMLPGGFSGGDEPDGSAKFIAAFFRNPSVADAVNRLLNQRDGLALGICNGFQALIKLGLVPYGEIRPITESDPTLTFNTIHRHQSMLVRTAWPATRAPAEQMRHQRRAPDRHQPRRGPLCLQRAAAEPAHRQRPDCDPVR
mgnify:CR=1 FL=1